MRNLFIVFLFIIYGTAMSAQILVNPTSSEGSGYSAIISSGLDIENPDCEHSSFGPHITQGYDELLDRNIFRFHSHIDADNDRCQTFDRVRMEIKGGPNTDAESQHALESESYYRWKFKLPSDFKGSSSFCHIFQNKIRGGADSGFPIVTITPRSSTLQVIHNGGDTGQDLGKVVEVDLEPFLDNWIEVYVYQKHSENGVLEMTMRDIRTGVQLVNYKNENIDLWRTGGDYSRPKWGVYRKKVEGLKDEIVEFADFCISETSEALCPADSIFFEDTEPPTTPLNLKADNLGISKVDLTWETSTDDFGLVSYIVYQNADSIWSGAENTYSVSGLEGGNSYDFQVKAVDNAGNSSPLSTAITITTYPADALPNVPTVPFPSDGAIELPNSLTLKWEKGSNTDSSLVFFGSEDDLLLVSSQVDQFYSLSLDFDSTYFWQIGQKNINGITMGPIWSFSTRAEIVNQEWLVYLGNARPDLETNFLSGINIPEMPEIDKALQGPVVPGNQVYQYFEDSEEKFRWRYDIAETDTAFTAVARIKGFQDATNVGFLEVRLGGYREKLRINHSTFKLERTNPAIEKEYAFDFDAEFHMIRITMQDRVMKVYLDEEPEPFAVGFSETLDAASNFEFGKSGGIPTGSFIDWVTILPNQALAPGQGLPLPLGLIQSHDPSLSEILLDSQPLEGFSPEVLTYELALVDETLPSLEVVTSSILSTYSIDTIDGEAITKVQINVLAQDSFSQRSYELNFRGTSSINESLTAEDYLIYPNPSTGSLTIEFLTQKEAQVSIFDSSGRLLSNLPVQKHMHIARNLKAGLYIVKIEIDNGEKVFRKIIVR